MLGAPAPPATVFLPERPDVWRSSMRRQLHPLEHRTRVG